MQQTTAPQLASVTARRPGARWAWVGQAFLALLALAAIIILGYDAIKDPRLFIQIVLSGLQLGFVYALIALGYTMVYGIVKLINFAHGDVFMVGAMVSYYAVARFQLHLWPAAFFPNLPPLAIEAIGSLSVILLSMLICTLLAVTIERVAYKPLRDAPRIALPILVRRTIYWSKSCMRIEATTMMIKILEKVMLPGGGALPGSTA